MKKYIAEAIGTFFWVLTVVMSVNTGAGTMAPFAMGATLMVMVYAGKHLSGAHFNPAVSVAMLMRGELDRNDFPYYLLAQLGGAILASLLGTFLIGCSGGIDIRPVQHQAVCSLLAEFIGTFALVYVILNISSTKTDQANGYFGLAIGFTLSAVAYSLGAVSGGAFNPAVAVGMFISGMASWADWWIYVVGTLLGAATAATLFQYLSKPE